jgi:hypothetical protein
MAFRIESAVSPEGQERDFDREGTRYFFRLRSGWCGCVLAYHVALVPIEFTGRTIGSFNPNTNPWRCEACGERVGSRSPGGDSSATWSGSWDHEGRYWQL